MLTALFKRTFDIRDGEIRISFFMQLYIFLLITVLLMVKPTVNALFLSKLGAAHLPYAYMLVAVIAVIVSYFYNKGVKQFSLRKITTGTLIFFSLIFALLSFLMYTNSINNWVLYGYYLSVSIFAVLVTSQFWIIANMVYNAREAKRLFGFIGAGAIAGGIFGGYLTTIIASSFGNRVVILVAACLIVCCVPILQTVWKLRVEKLNMYIRKQRKGAIQGSYSSPFKLIINSKHLTYLAAIVGVGVVMAKLVDFQFSDFANKAIPDSDELASFFGFWFSSFNVIALLIQLFLTNRLLAWLGVTTNLLILPLGIAIGCLLFLTFPELWVLIIIKGMDGSFKQSINKAGIELSILPIPSHIKNEAKSYIDVVVDSIATGLAGLMLIFIIRKLELSTSYITVIILLFLFIWMVLIYKLREAYFQSFRSNIQNSLVGASVENKNLKFNRTSKSTINILTQGDETEIITMLDHLADFKLYTFRPHIVNLLKHESPKVKAAAISQLHYYNKGTATEYIKELIHFKNDEVVYAAMDYLLNHTDIKEENIFKSYLDSPTDYISNAALLCLAKDASSNKKLALRYHLSDRLDAKIKELFSVENDLRKQEVAELMLAVGYAKDPRFYSFISANFNNRDPYLIKFAITAAGLTAHEPFINQLLDFLAEKPFREAATEALQAYGVGITKKVLQLELSESLPDTIKPYIPELIQSFKTRDSVKVLMRFLQSKDFVIRTEAAKSLNTLKLENVSLAVDQRMLTRILLRESVFYRNTLHAIITLKGFIDTSQTDSLDTDAEIESSIARENLVDLLLEQLNQSLDCIFKLFSLKYDQADIDTAYFGLKSEKQDVRINAIEFLDNLLKSRLKSNILPLIEYHVLENNGYAVSSFEAKVKPEKEILTMLLRNRGTRMKLAVLNVIKFSGNDAYLSVVKPLIKHPNLVVQRFAIRTVKELKMASIEQ
ncbi:NTP/NDP exchange transporter [Rasiella sp. SM2506]|uniref:NTP/NDP exchange transporter n=1 Tax=Rasiella sp. SM2506 TaxID=3423914 RepID=UPI003D7A06C4